MSDAPRPDPKRIPQITALSTAFPMQIEPDPRRGIIRNSDAEQPTRPPHRHDAGE